MSTGGYPLSDAVCGPLEAIANNPTLPDEVRQEATRRLNKLPWLMVIWYFLPMLGIGVSALFLAVLWPQIEVRGTTLAALAGSLVWLRYGLKALKRYVLHFPAV